MAGIRSRARPSNATAGDTAAVEAVLPHRAARSMTSLPASGLSGLALSQFEKHSADPATELQDVRLLRAQQERRKAAAFSSAGSSTRAVKPPASPDRVHELALPQRTMGARLRDALARDRNDDACGRHYSRHGHRGAQIRRRVNSEPPPFGAASATRRADRRKRRAHSRPSHVRPRQSG
jgi:hypothetical protein